MILNIFESIFNHMEFRVKANSIRKIFQNHDSIILS